MNIDLTEKWAKEIALMSDAEFEENCKHIETLLKRRKQALRIHDVSGQFPNNLILYRQAKKLNYAQFCEWLNAKLGNLR